MLRLNADAMKVLLLAHHSILVSPHSKNWISSLQSQLLYRNIDATLFEQTTHKLENFDIIHSFGFGNFELLWNQQRLGKLTVCTPFFDFLPKRNFASRLAEKLLFVVHVTKQQKLNPVSQFCYMREVNRHIVYSTAPHSWAQSWGLPPKNVRYIPLDVREAAPKIAAIYLEMCKSNTL